MIAFVHCEMAAFQQVTFDNYKNTTKWTKTTENFSTLLIFFRQIHTVSTEGSQKLENTFFS